MKCLLMTCFVLAIISFGMTFIAFFFWVGYLFKRVKMKFQVAEVKVLKDRMLGEIILKKGSIATVSSVQGGDENSTLKLWHGEGQYEDYQEYYDIDNPVLIIKK